MTHIPTALWLQRTVCSGRKEKPVRHNYCAGWSSNYASNSGHFPLWFRILEFHPFLKSVSKFHIHCEMSGREGKRASIFLKFSFHTGHCEFWFLCILLWTSGHLWKFSLILCLHSSIWLETSWSVLLDPWCLWRCRMNVVLLGGVLGCRHTGVFGVCFVHFALSSTANRNTILFIFISISKYCLLAHRGML